MSVVSEATKKIEEKAITQSLMKMFTSSECASLRMKSEIGVGCLERKN